jgi:hypothetical protein
MKLFSMVALALANAPYPGAARFYREVGKLPS